MIIFSIMRYSVSKLHNIQKFSQENFQEKSLKEVDQTQIQIL